MGESRNIFSALSPVFNKNVYAFFICLAIAALCWFLIVLSKPFDATIKYKINYTNLSASKAVANKLPDSIDVTVNTDGYTLLKNKIFGRKTAVNIDCSHIQYSSENTFFITLISKTSSINNQIGKSYYIIKIAPDTIYFNFSNKSQKRVPVKANISFDFAEQYQLSDSITVTPNYVDIFGPIEIIQKTTDASTQFMSLSNINKTTTIKIPFASNNRNIGYSTDSVTITIPVDKYTEAEIEVPVTPINLPANYTMRIFPEKIKIKYRAPVSKIDEINADLFSAIADYSKIIENSNKIKIELTQSPTFVNTIKLVPEKAEYIIRKK